MGYHRNSMQVVFVRQVFAVGSKTGKTELDFDQPMQKYLTTKAK